MAELSYNTKTKDSVFTKLFSDKENVLQLYKDLNPDDTDITVDDINIQTLESVLAHTIYNDLGFIAKERFVLLVEAQSRWNNNMALRMAFYLFETYRRYLDITKQSEHYPTKVRLPMPELYVVYTGDRKNVPKEISFNEDFFNGKSPVDIRVKILNQADSTIYGQYIGFCKVFDEQYKLNDNKLKCAEETVKLCLDKGYLVNFLAKHKSEVISMMSELFDEQRIRESYEMAEREHERIRLAEIRESAMAKGRAEGRAEGEAKGRAEGKSERDSEIYENMKNLGYSDEEINKILTKNK